MAPGLPPTSDSPGAGRLNGWREIARHFGKGVRTIQRWEKEYDLPVHRLEAGTERADPVFAFVDELETLGPRRRCVAAGRGRGDRPSRAAARGDARQHCWRSPRRSAALGWLAAASARPHLRRGTAGCTRARRTAFAWPARRCASRTPMGVSCSSTASGSRSQRRRRSAPPLGRRLASSSPTWRATGASRCSWRSRPSGARSAASTASRATAACASCSSPGATCASAPSTTGSPWLGFGVWATRLPGEKPALWFASVHTFLFPTRLQRLGPRGELLAEYWSDGYCSASARAAGAAGTRCWWAASTTS